MSDNLKTEAMKSSEIHQMLTFKLDNELFGVPITQVIEVLEYQKITKVPRTPDYMKGVINVRGSVEPVVDIKKKFGMGETVIGEETGIIIMEMNINGEVTQVGILTDAVEEVIDLKDSDIQPAPKSSSDVNADYIDSVGKIENGFIVILALSRVFENEDFLLAKESR